MTEDRDPFIDELPGVLREIADAINLATALQIAQAFGGTKIYVPESPIARNRLVAEIGPEAARKVTEIFGSGDLLIPLGPTTDYARKRRQIIKLTEQGYSSFAIARRLSCHHRTVIRIRSAATDADKRQLDFFGKA